MPSQIQTAFRVPLDNFFLLDLVVVVVVVNSLVARLAT